MAITVRGTSTGPNGNGTTTAISLPAGVAVGDVSFIVYGQACAAGTPPTLTPPAGWNVLANASGTVVCWRAFQAGDATTGITATSTLTNWWQSLCITYTGLNTASPIDAQSSNFSFSPGGLASSVTICRANLVCPNWMGSQLLCIYTNNSSAGATIGLPPGLTAQVAAGGGPNVRMCDKALVDGTPTGIFDASVTPATQGLYYFGMQLALKALGAAAATLAPARPQIAGTYNASSNVLSSFTAPLADLNVQNGDMVVVGFAPAPTATPPAGYTQRSAQLGVLIYTHLWQTGDTLAPAFTPSVSGFTAVAVSLVRVAGVSASPISFDQITTAGNTGNPVATTVATQTPANALEMLLVAFGTSTTAAGTWSGITGAGLIDEAIQINGPGFRWSWASPAAVPTGTFSATWTASTATLGGAAMLLSLAGGAVVTSATARAMVLA